MLQKSMGECSSSEINWIGQNPSLSLFSVRRIGAVPKCAQYWHHSPKSFRSLVPAETPWSEILPQKCNNAALLNPVGRCLGSKTA